MRFLVVLILNALSSSLLLHFLPWWICLPIAFLIILMLPLKKLSAFLASGLGTSICWILYSSISDFHNGHILSGKIATLFHLPSWMFVLIITAVIGFITGGLGGFTAATFFRFPREIALQEGVGK